MRVFLSGPMGSGKSTLGPLVAKALDLSFVDIDTEIEETVKCSVSDYFQSHGEVAFREVEASVLLDVLQRDSVCVALGGGSVLNTPLRRRMLREGVLVGLGADTERLIKRTQDTARPLLNAQGALENILHRRAAVYAECHGQVSTNGSVEDAVKNICRLATLRPLVVPLGRRSYPVFVGEHLTESMTKSLRGESVFIVGDEGAKPWVDEIAEGCEVLGRIDVPGGEASKHLNTIANIYDEALRVGVSRQTVLVSIGGGAVGDMAAFAASTLLRGIPLVQVPTTLLSMVDSSVGGKTGFNRSGGKNLVGSFYQPKRVYCSTHTLDTLSEDEYRSGFAEALKAAYLRGESALSEFEQLAHTQQFLKRRGAGVQACIRHAIQLKSDVVVEDEREAGKRKLLNLGHTVGHVLEADAGFGPLRHGEAVGLGLIAACRVAEGLGEGRGQATRITALLSALGLPTDLDRRLPQDPRFHELLTKDKKRGAQGQIDFVLPLGPGNVEIRPLSVEEIAQASKTSAKT